MTEFKDLLVVLDDSAACAARLDAAVQVASRFGAHLTGLFVTPPLNVPAPAESEFPGHARTVTDYMERQRQASHEAALSAHDLFRARAEVAGITTEWREREGEVTEVASLHARYADLVIVGQMEPALPTGHPARALPERLLLGVGRPILVVPYAGVFNTVGERVLVAWNASREATRAVNDALPVLQRAAHVTVLALNPRGGVSGDGDLPGADLALHLSRHGVNAEASWLQAEEIAVAVMLLSRACDLHADLIVMGGYGHSRVREIVLGGGDTGDASDHDRAHPHVALTGTRPTASASLTPPTSPALAVSGRSIVARKPGAVQGVQKGGTRWPSLRFPEGR